MSEAIASAGEVGNSRHAPHDHRLIERITGHPRSDAILADMIHVADQVEAEALGRRFATSLGRGSAERYAQEAFLPTHAIALAAQRAGHPAEGDFADELFEIFYEDAWPERTIELSEGIIKETLEAIEEIKEELPSNKYAMLQELKDAAEDIGRSSDAPLKETIGRLVVAAEVPKFEVGSITEELLLDAERGRRGRDFARRSAYNVAKEDFDALSQLDGGLCFPTYLINAKTGRVVVEEEREAEDAAHAKAEAVEAFLRDVRNIANAKRAGAPFNVLLLEAFLMAFQGRHLSVNAEQMVDRIAEAIGAGPAEIDIERVLEHVVEAAYGSRDAADAEGAFMRLLAAEGVAAPATRWMPAPPLPAPIHDLVSTKGPRQSGIPKDVEAKAMPEGPPSAGAHRAEDERLMATAEAKFRANRSMSLCEEMKIVRQVARATTIQAEQLSEHLAQACGACTDFGRDAIRISIREARRDKGPGYDDARVEARVEDLLAKKHAPVTGEPGLREARAQRAQAIVAPSGVRGPTPFVWCDPDSLPRRDWLYGHFLIRKEISATVSPGGVGKTALGIGDSLAMVSGQPLLGIRPTGRLRVWCWNGEEPTDELKRRIMAACRHHELSAADIEGLFVDNFETVDFVIAEQTRDGTKIFRPVVDVLVAWLVANRIDVLMIDPVISTHNVNENDNVAIQKVATAWKEVAVRANVAIVIAHHTRKLAGKEATTEDSRGAKAFTDKCRVVRALNHMTKEEAERFDVPVDQRRLYFSIDQSEMKGNMSPAIGGKLWFRSVSVMLGAGRRGNLDQGDSVGVVESWRPPTSVEKIEGEQIGALRDAMGGKSWRAASNKFGEPDSIGAPIAGAFGLDLMSQGDVRKARALYARLKADGILVEEKVVDDNYKRRPVARFHDR